MPVQRSTDNNTGTALEEFQAYFEYFRLEERYPGSNACVYCGESFTNANPCWNSEAEYPDGTHGYGQCRSCATRYPQRGKG